MLKAILKKASLVCLLSLLFVMKGNASHVNWYCDPNNGTYSIIDITESFLGVLPAGNPYRITMPQNIAEGEVMTAFFKTRCESPLWTPIHEYELTLTAKDANGNPLTGFTHRWKKHDWSPTATFEVRQETSYFDFLYRQNGNTKLKFVKLWVPMPKHLDARDQVMCDSVEMGKDGIFYVRLNTFFTEEGNQTITITKTGDNNDFEVVRGELNMEKRCGTNACLGLFQKKYFENTNDINNMFKVRFTPTTPGEQSCTFTISNGSQTKEITLTAKGYQRNAKFYAVGNGHVELYVGGSAEAITTSPYIFNEGDQLRFVAVPDEGHHFVNWNLNIFQNDPEISMIGTQSFSLYANFAPNYYKVWAAPDVPCHGRVHFGTIPMDHYFHGHEVLFSACPAPGYKFVGWTTCEDPETIVSTEANYTITLTGHVCLIAHFALDNPEPEPEDDDRFRFVCETNGSTTIKYENNRTDIPDEGLPKFEVSRDGEIWSEYNSEDITLTGKGDSVFFRAKDFNSYGVRGQGVVSLKKSDEEILPAFFITDSVSVAGNIAYLINKNLDDFVELPSYAFTAIFATQPIIYADKLVLPFQTLKHSAFNEMFRGCNKLKTAPALPATELANACYGFMFMNCTSLVAAPALPAQVVNKSAYFAMFYNCEKLTDVPEISADTVGEQGFSNMFNGCVNLVNVPETLPAKIADESYAYMFNGCVSLTEAPALPAMNLASSCYSCMFMGCSSLQEAPVLPATTMVDYCYYSMFENCSLLERIEVGFAKFDQAEKATYNWTKYVAEEGNFIAPNMAEKDQKFNNASSKSYIPVRWQVQNNVNAPRHSSVETQYIAMAEGMDIIVKGAENANISVYDMSGRLVSTVENASDFETINMQVPGIYVVNVAGQEATRVIVK
ncbi:MAG: T9SS type A sorting domain-containing protein [Paludibacteraceae bacterium]|nr:T9SS type A sorting domain-containing protein [Paludibacteraceae bacterium]